MELSDSPTTTGRSFDFRGLSLHQIDLVSLLDQINLHTHYFWTQICLFAHSKDKIPLILKDLINYHFIVPSNRISYHKHKIVCWERERETKILQILKPWKSVKYDLALTLKVKWTLFIFYLIAFIEIKRISKALEVFIFKVRINSKRERERERERERDTHTDCLVPDKWVRIYFQSRGKKCI